MKNVELKIVCISKNDKVGAMETGGLSNNDKSGEWGVKSGEWRVEKEDREFKEIREIREQGFINPLTPLITLNTLNPPSHPLNNLIFRF